jgi:hypothetical protein
VGLPEGRYLVRHGDTERVLIVEELGAPPPRRRAGRRSKPIEPGDPAGIPVTRVTVTGVQVGTAEEGTAWLREMMGSGGEGATQVREATRIVNRALSALRAGARDPLVQDIGATRALAVRLGHGTGDELADGAWTEARELARPRRGRLDDVDPQSRVAAVLAGRDEVHPAETLMLRARLDLQQGRLAEARYGLRAARAALDEEPGARQKEMREELASIEQKLEEAG